MSAARVLLKNKSANQFLSWIAKTLGGHMETRHVRVTWDTFEKSKVKAQFKIYPNGKSIIPQLIFPGLIQSRSNMFEKADFDTDESKSMLRDLLSSVSEISLRDSNDLHKSGFIREAPELAGDRIIVEYGSPNIAKPMHMGHLRSLVTGHFVDIICKAVGHDVVTICFLGDWGTQFGILQAGLAKWLPEDKSVLLSVEKLTLDELLRYYVQAVQEKESNEVFLSEAMKMSAALEKGDGESLKVWKSIREKTVDHLKSFWSLFEVQYDVIQGESEFTVQNKYTQKALEELTSLGVIEKGDDNCVYVVLPPDEKFLKPMKIPLIKKDGTSLYLLRDIACALSRKENFSYNRMTYVVDKTQAQHFIALFRILEMLKIQHNKYHNDEWERKLLHITFGKVEGMSTRSGNFVLLSDVINTGSTIMQENRMKSPNTRNIEDKGIATQLAISALIVNSLKVRRNRDVKFDWDEALRPTGDTGVNLQYAHARLVSLEKKAKTHFQEQFAVNLVEGFESSDIDMDYLVNDPLALDLAMHLVNFEDTLWASYTELEPCTLLTYLFKLSDKSSKALKNLKVISEPNKDIATTRLLLYILSRQILAVGLHTLGINPMDEL